MQIQPGINAHVLPGVQFVVFGQPFEHETETFFVDLLLSAKTTVEVISVNANTAANIFFIFLYLKFKIIIIYFLLHAFLSF